MEDRVQSEDNGLVESAPTCVISSCAKQDEDSYHRQTAQISLEEDVEFIQTHYSPRGVILVYFKGDAPSEVDRHFSRTLTELCFLSDEVEDDAENSHLQGKSAVPMSQRDFPASFWNPTLFKQSQPLEMASCCQGSMMETTSYCHSNTVNIVTISDCHSNTINNMELNHNAANCSSNGSCLFTDQQGSSQQNQPNVISARSVPVSYASHPVESFVPGPSQQLPAYSVRLPAPPYPYLRRFRAHFNDSENCFKFDPIYNPLLVQPEVEPHLPMVPGEPRAKQHRRGQETAEGFFERDFYQERRELAQSQAQMLSTQGENT